MKCPVCGKEMPIQRTDVSNNQARDKKDLKEYKRIVYWCEKDDAWTSVEIPFNKN